MSKEFAWSVFKRFLRAFVSGGAAQLVLMFASGNVAIDSWNDFSHWLIVLLVAFITGGVMAIDKLLRFDPDKESN